jgi:DNA-binding transcriptional MerR regulator
MRVNQLAQKMGISGDTVRYYTRIGYVHPIKSKANGYKEYSEKDEHRLRFILSARQLGFTVEDIGQIIGEAEKGKTPCPTVRRMIDQRLHETEQRFSQTMALRKRMQAAIKDWDNKPDKAPTGDMICHLIENFSYTK